MKIRFDHTYTEDHNHQFRKKLGKAGFALGDKLVEHPGKAFCMFLIMPPTKMGRQYLEFVHIGKGAKKDGVSGFSLATRSALKPFCRKLISKKVPAVFGHKNYNWKENSVDHLPGWNFIHFPKHKSKISTWLTEYEMGRKALNYNHSKHPNQVYKIVGFEMTLSLADIKLYSQLFGKPKGNCFTLSGGNTLKFVKVKTSRMNRVILATRDLRKFAQKFPWDALTTVEDQPAIQINNPNPRMWDVVIIQGDHN